MTEPGSGKVVERMFPFVLRAKILIVGRESLKHSKRRLHFVLVTHDLSENSRAAILKEFAFYPIVQHYTSGDLETHFGVTGAKVIGFAKSGLAQSIYAELKPHRINKAPVSRAEPPAGPAPSGTAKHASARGEQKGKAPASAPAQGTAP